MIDQLQHLIENLREELKQYGEMLALLDEQQEYLTQRAGDRVLQSVRLIEAQGEVIHRARTARDKRRSLIARLCDLEGTAPFSDIIPRLPGDYQPLVQALVQENNELLVRVQQRARQNHLLLRRSLEIMQGFLEMILPAPSVPVYNDAGALFASSSQRPAALYEAVG